MPSNGLARYAIVSILSCINSCILQIPVLHPDACIGCILPSVHSGSGLCRLFAVLYSMPVSCSLYVYLVRALCVSGPDADCCERHRLTALQL